MKASLLIIVVLLTGCCHHLAHQRNFKHCVKWVVEIEELSELGAEDNTWRCTGWE